MKNNLFRVDGRFYYGWVMLLCGFICLFVCDVIKNNCSPLFYAPICEELGITRSVYVQTNTFLIVAQLISSFFIGKIYKRFRMKWVFSVCMIVVCVCFLCLSRATALWQFYLLSAIQGVGWSGATNIPVSLMASNWFGPKVKGTALSIALMGNAVGALVWVNLIQSVILSHGWRTAYLVEAGITVCLIPFALALLVDYPSDKAYSHRVGDPTAAAGETQTAQLQGLTGLQAVRTARWWLQWFAHMLVVIAAAGFISQFVLYYTDLTGDDTKAALVYSTACGVVVIGKFLLGLVSDLIHVKRSSFIAAMIFAGTFICLALATNNPGFFTGVIWTYMIGGAMPHILPPLVSARNFGDKELGVLNSWMNMSGNIGQIVGPIVCAFIFDTTGSYQMAWVILAVIAALSGVCYLLSCLVSRQKVIAMGYKPD